MGPGRIQGVTPGIAPATAVSFITGASGGFPESSYHRKYLPYSSPSSRRRRGSRGEVVREESPRALGQHLESAVEGVKLALIVGNNDEHVELEARRIGRDRRQVDGNLRIPGDYPLDRDRHWHNEGWGSIPLQLQLGLLLERGWRFEEIAQSSALRS